MIKKSICVIEDEQDIRESVQEFFEYNDYEVFAFSSAEDYYKNANTQDFCGVYLLDWSLPGDSGIDIVKKIRSEDKISPIFILSAKSGKEEILEGLSAGADDYMTKPFSFEELSVRVDNAAAKFELVLQQSQLEDFRLLPEAHAFLKSGKTVNLTAREYIIFEYLVKHTGQPVTRDLLIECFSNEEKMTNRNIDVHVFSLRKKLKAVEMHIETVWGKGYKLV
ncbi:MAG: response regulator transcription factor [Bacteriovoracaceae bacterium]|nr:response regulator transcription factor [Bacteriovoracaceae bacterium]